MPHGLSASNWPWQIIGIQLEAILGSDCTSRLLPPCIHWQETKQWKTYELLVVATVYADILLSIYSVSTAPHSCHMTNPVD